MSGVKIRVNTFNRLKKIRAGVVYDSITTVLDELLQNCQRSFIVSQTKNPVIDVVAEGDKIIIRDNGKGCSDPQSIFEFETSGWDISDAFGQGGSESVFQIADYIEIHSQDWKAYVDVNKVLETEDLSVEIMTGFDDYLEGYEVCIWGTKIKEHAALLKSYLISTLSVYPYTCYVNGNVVPKKDLHDFKSVHKLRFENQFYVATLGVQKGWTDCQVYYEKRKVCDIWKLGVYGIIELKRDAVNLKAPDRKSIIYDKKYDDFKKCFNDDCKVLYLDFVQNSDISIFDEYEQQIDTNLTPQDYADYLPFYNKLEYDHHRLKVLSAEVPSNGTVETLKDAEHIVARFGSSSGVYVSDTVDVKSEYKLKKVEKGEFKKKLGKILNMVWCEFERKESLQEMINKAESYNIKVIYSKNKLYAKAFEYWGIPHIEKIMNKTEARYIISSPSGIIRETTRKEERLLSLLKTIERYYGLEDVFRIADVNEHLRMEHDGEVVMDTVIKAPAAPIKDRNKIYLDRSALNLGKVNITESKSLITKFDVLVIMLNVQTIASGLAQLLYNTIEKTVEHYNKVEKISKEIALLLASL